MTVRLSLFDPANHLNTEEDVLYYIEAAMEGGDPKHIARALCDVARSEAMAEISRETGFDADALLENGDPTLETLTSTLSLLGIELTVRKRAA